MKKLAIVALVIISLCVTVLPAVSVSASTQLEAQAIPLRFLGFSAPDDVFVEQPVPIKVYDQMTNWPVSWAGVWALELDGKLEGQDPSLLADMARDSGDFLGWTKENGYIMPYPRFKDTGTYLLVVMKQGWNPAFTTMEVKPHVPMGMKAPEEVFVGQTIPIYVFDRNDGSPMNEARVWAIDLTVASAIPEDADVCAELAEKHGIYLGSTDKSGYVIPYPHLTDPGRYVLLALKPWHTPAYAKLSVKPLVPMGIRAPAEVSVGQTIPIYVFDRNDGSPINEARVWAIDLTVASDIPEDADACTKLAEKHGIYLGSTDKSGYVIPYPRLTDPGRYVLLALKQWHTPTCTRLLIKPLGDMGIKAPDIVSVGRPVPIKVYDQDDGDPIYRAGVWAVELALINEVTSDNVAIAEIAQNSGSFLGWTNRNGYVDPYPQFNDPGKYALVALKYGYNPAVKMIKVVRLQPSVAEKLTAIR
ncbi:hypothetical protein ACFLVE_03195 [Chloroflexota bacterium]